MFLYKTLCKAFLFLLAVHLLFSASPVYALCVINKTANLRAGPGTKYKKTWEVHKYTPLQFVSRKGKWIKVKDVDGDLHWVFSKLVSSKVKCATIKDKKGANVWKGPTSKSQRLNDKDKKVPKYASFLFVKKKAKWVQLKDLEGMLFWVYAPNVWMP